MAWISLRPRPPDSTSRAPNPAPPLWAGPSLWDFHPWVQPKPPSTGQELREACISKSQGLDTWHRIVFLWEDKQCPTPKPRGQETETKRPECAKQQAEPSEQSPLRAEPPLSRGPSEPSRLCQP